MPMKRVDRAEHGWVNGGALSIRRANSLRRAFGYDARLARHWRDARGEVMGREAWNGAVNEARVEVVTRGVVLGGGLPILIIARLGSGRPDPTRGTVMIAMAVETVEGGSSSHKLRGPRPSSSLEVPHILSPGEIGKLAADAPNLLIRLGTLQPRTSIGPEELVLVMLWVSDIRLLGL